MKVHRPALAIASLAALAAAMACSSSSSPPLGTYVPGDGGGPADDGSSGSSGGSSSGGSSSGGSSSGGSSGSSGDAGTPPGCTGLAYCEDFEAYTGAITNAMAMGPWKAAVNGTLTTFAVDTTRAHTGSKALHVTIPAGAAARGTLNQAKPAGLVTGNNLYGRAWVYYSDQGGNGLPLAVHSWLFNASGTSTADDGGVTMNMGGGGAKMQLNYHPPPPAGEQSVQGGVMTAGTWHCVQWQYDGSGTPPADTAKVWVDGTVAVDVPVAKAWAFATPWSSFDFGFTHYQTLAAGVDVWLDDFALNSAMVTCP